MGKKFSLHIFNPCPKEASDFPQKCSSQHTGPSAPFRQEFPMVMTCLIFFMEAVLTQANLTLVTAPCKMSHCPHCSVLPEEPCTHPYLLLALYPPIFSCSQLLWSMYVLFLAENPMQYDPGYQHLLSGTVTLTKHLVILLIKAIHISIELLVNTALSLTSVA